MTITLQAVNELIASLASAGELSIKETKVMALAKAYQQLAAENVVMIRLLTDISENHVEYYSEGEDGMFAGVPLDYVSEINMYVSRDVNAENPFTATDRIVAGIKADGVEEFAAKLRIPGDDQFFDALAKGVALAADDFAKQLREGEDK
ncbi:hypothetical protein ACOIHK_19190 [Klebsiella pneumoniae]|uniref:hypothetical protein n=2 Tax=Klebsiella pneumoniae TaxID=573 RepID=UPI0007B3A864|nr:hypothetical protein [Klebsiella pneumoniae]AUN71740.1 hypothetical protein C0077_05250 [Klebsiella pneumoniae]AWY25315.1 hypothetical protein DQB68_19100 [Klebsiella pneumoniae subsp. pneumoniae]KAB7742544.1 hypothetical protein GB874_26215 [Klebsiella pneumoniae]MBC4507081.1 hypothetical protein [Klebsiella pneumoniae]MBC5446454.1 hypothetical protein [Klebsiella pneumoniae]